MESGDDSQKSALTRHNTVNRSTLTHQGTMNYRALPHQATMNPAALIGPITIIATMILGGLMRQGTAIYSGMTRQGTSFVWESYPPSTDFIEIIETKIGDHRCVKVKNYNKSFRRTPPDLCLSGLNC